MRSTLLTTLLALFLSTIHLLAINGTWQFEGYHREVTTETSTSISPTSGSLTFSEGNLIAVSTGEFSLNRSISLIEAGSLIWGSDQTTAKADGFIKTFTVESTPLPDGGELVEWSQGPNQQPDLAVKEVYSVALTQVLTADPDAPETWLVSISIISNHAQWNDSRTLAAVRAANSSETPEMLQLITASTYTKSAEGITGVLREAANSQPSPLAWNGKYQEVAMSQVSGATPGTAENPDLTLHPLSSGETWGGGSFRVDSEKDQLKSYINGESFNSPKITNLASQTDASSKGYLLLGDGSVLAISSGTSSGLVTPDAAGYDSHKQLPATSVTGFTLRSRLFTPEPYFGTITVAQGYVHVIRNEKKVPLEVGNRVYQDEDVVTGTRSLLKVDLIEGSKLTLGSNSRMTLETISKKEPGIINFIKGQLRSDPSTLQLDKVKNNHSIKIQTKTSTFGVRGTLVDFTLDEADGMESVNAVVDHGTVDVLDPDTGSVESTLTDGMSVNLSNSLPTHTLTIDHPGGVGGKVFLNDEEIISFPHVVTATVASLMELKAVRDSGYRFSGWTGFEDYPDEEFVISLEEDLNFNANFAAFDISSVTYWDLWNAETGYDSYLRQPDRDINFDGVSNALAWAMGHLPLDPLPADFDGPKPTSTPSLLGRKFALSFKLADSPPSDVSWVLEHSESLNPEDWSEVARKNALTSWTGTASSSVTQGSAQDGFRSVTVENPASFDSYQTGFMRLRIEVEEPNP